MKMGEWQWGDALRVGCWVKIIKFESSFKCINKSPLRQKFFFSTLSCSQNMSSTVVMFLGFAFLIAITSAQSTGPVLNGEFKRFPGGHSESIKITHDAWQSRDGNWRAGGYIQHDRERFNGMRHSNTHGGLSITGRFRRNAEPDGNRPTLTIDHSRYPGGHSESFKLSQDAWQSRDGNWRAGGYIQHDREKFNGMRHSNTHGGLSITGRFRRNAEPDGNRPTLTGEISHTRFPGGHAESA
ncbi:unnamed protein product, partial [Nesidiocoris tenuis]